MYMHLKAACAAGYIQSVVNKGVHFQIVVIKNLLMQFKFAYQYWNMLINFVQLNSWWNV